MGSTARGLGSPLHLDGPGRRGSDLRDFLMHVIAGKFRRRVLQSLEGSETRPMLGRMRQTMFDVLQGEIPGRVFADLYAGTGAVGIEALSRGAASAVFVESSHRAAKVIGRNLVALEITNQADVRIAPVQDVVAGIEADIYFLGPPYEATNEYAGALELLSTKPAEWVIAQHGKGLALSESYGNLKRVRVIKVGGNRLSLFRSDLQD